MQNLNLKKVDIAVLMEHSIDVGKFSLKKTGARKT